MDEDEGPHEDLNEHEMSEKLVTLIKASKNLINVVMKSVQITTIPRASKMNKGHRRIVSLVQRLDMEGR